MTEQKLNEEYIRNKIKGICQDCMILEKIIPIIREMLSEQYIIGLEQGKFDHQMEQLDEEDLLKIINHYGVMPQLKYFQSEVFELTEAIIDYRYVEVYKGSSAEKYHKEHITEEIADCYVTLEQFRLYYDISTEQIKDIMISNVNRQLKRIENRE